jgi:carboxylesterase type B
MGVYLTLNISNSICSTFSAFGMKSFGIAQALFWVLVPVISHPRTPPPIAKTDFGLVQGIRASDQVNAFLGIPFAKPPINDLRWKPPQPPKQLNQSKGVLNASQFGDSCFQVHYGIFLIPGQEVDFPDTTMVTNSQSEDCLSLNVFVPSAAVTNKKKMPVFFWIYGGGFVEGGSSLPIYNPTNFIEETKDIIVVTSKSVQIYHAYARCILMVTYSYRLGLFGFPNSPALPNDGQNLGIRDQRLAIEWVHDNIAAFGGDPEHIVIGGESAGGAFTDAAV